MKAKKKICVECASESYIWSKGRCKKCASRSYAKLGPSKKAKEKIDLDTRFYKEIWASRPHYCEECSVSLGDKWERYMFSHILSKGANPKMRHEPSNINVLCFDCHQRWEFGDRKGMKIYPGNQVLIDELRRLFL